MIRIYLKCPSTSIVECDTPEEAVEFLRRVELQEPPPKDVAAVRRAIATVRQDPPPEPGVTGKPERTPDGRVRGHFDIQRPPPDVEEPAQDEDDKGRRYMSNGRLIGASDRIVDAFAADYQYSLARLAVELYDDANAHNIRRLKRMIVKLCSSGRLRRVGAAAWKPMRHDGGNATDEAGGTG